MDEYYRVRIRTCPWTLGYEVYISCQEGKKVFVAEPVEFNFKEIELGGHCEPSLVIEHPFAKQFMKAFLDALEGQGIESDSVSRLKGTMEASKYHLEDMRRLVFRKEKKERRSK